MSRFAKQLIYGSFYLAIILAIIWGLYRLAVPAPTCTDGIQNQSEEGVDCGAVCGKSCPVSVLPLTIPLSQVINYDNDGSDVIVRIENPNAIYGASLVPYILTVKDASGGVLATRRGTTFANPLEPHYLVFPLIGLSGTPVEADLQLDATGVQWAALATQEGTGVEFAVRQDQLIPSDSSLRYRADVVNNSKFDFDKVEVAVLLYDQAGNVVGAGSTVLSTLTAGQLRGTVIDWPFAIPSAVRGQAFVTTNVFDNDNYIRIYGSQEQFQGF